MRSDLRQAIRHVAGAPWLAAIIVASLALGTGANAAVYSAIDALLFRPPAGVADPATLVDVYTSQMNGGSYGLSSYADYQSIATVSGFEAVAAIDDRADQAVRLGDGAAAPRIAAVTANFWSVLRMSPYAGSWTPDGVVLGYDAWQALGGDAGAVGRTVSVAGRDYRVTAIAPRGFRGLHLDRVFDVWIPLDAAEAAADGRGDRHLRVIGRMASRDAGPLRRSLSSLAASLARAYPKTNLGTIRTPDEPRRFTADSYTRLDPAIQWRTRILAFALLGATLLMLVSACLNTGSLLLSRGMARRTEFTIKAALGADRARLVRQMLLESVLLSGTGAVAGLLAAAWAAGTIPALFAPDHARLIDAHVDPAVMATTIGAAVLTGLLCGLAPALVSTRALSPVALRGDAARIGERQGGARLRLILVGAQLALSTIFLIGAALLTAVVDTSLGTQRSRAAGELTVATIELPSGGSSDVDYREKATAELRAVPAADVVGWVSSPPAARTARRTFRIARGDAAEPVELDVNFATRDYFRALYMPVIEGRGFAQEDALERDDVVIVNDALAQRYFAGQAVGRLLTDVRGKAVEIVGVVQTRNYHAFAGPPAPMVYYPMSRTIGRAFAAVVRSKAYTNADAPVTAALSRAGEGATVTVLSFDAYLARALAPDRLIARLAGACGAAALVLAVVGVYGVLGDLVRRRTREIGLRVALGASPRHVLQDVLGPGLTPTAVGIAAGVAAAEIATRVARSFVYELPGLDPGLTVATAGVLLVVVGAAVAPPALRALRINPIVVLRE